MKKVVLVLVILVLCILGMNYHNSKVEYERKIQENRNKMNELKLKREAMENRNETVISLMKMGYSEQEAEKMVK